MEQDRLNVFISGTDFMKTIVFVKQVALKVELFDETLSYNKNRYGLTIAEGETIHIILTPAGSYQL